MRPTSILFAASLVLAPQAAHAFCGFFVAGSDAKLSNNASQVVLLRNGNRTVLTMSNDYKGPPEDFALVVPVPVVLHKEDVKTLPLDVFDRIDSLSAPRLVEYWEQDPCYVERRKRKAGILYEDAVEGAAPPEEKAGHGVKIEAKFVAGEYQIVILSAEDSGGLEAWLKENKYRIPDGAAGALAPYVRDQMKFFVAKVDISKVHRDAQGVVQLSPLRFGYPSQELRLPVRLGLLNAQGKQDLIVYVLHPEKRFEAANVRNVFIPTNLDVADAVRKAFPSFYAQLFDETLARNHDKAVVTEYAWQTTSCDPCPTPPLTADEVATLGGDQAASAGAISSWVLTRLHTRYSKSTLSEDLVFKEASPIVGGRANWDGQSADSGAQPSSENNFQGRYIIRHYWTGPVSCAHPVYGRWGGPPNGEGSTEPTPAKGLARAPRGKIDLAKVVRSKVPSLGLAGQPPPHRK